MHNFGVAYRTLDLDLYRDQLDTTYVLVPPERHRGRQEELRAQGVTDYEFDVASTKELFEAAERVVLTMSATGNKPNSVPGYPASDGFREVEVKDFSFTITLATQRRLPGANQALRVVMAPDSSRTPPTYRVVYLEDLGSQK